MPVQCCICVCSPRLQIVEVAHPACAAQTKTGITVPAVLVPFMGGLTEIPFTRDPPSNFAKLRAEAGAAKKAAAAAAAAGGDAPATAEAPAAKPAVAPKPAKAAAAPKEAKPTAAKVAAKPAAAAPTTAAAAAGAPAAPAGSLAQLNDKLLLQSYVAGFAPSKADNVEFKKLGDAPVDAAAYPNVARWQRNIASFTAAQRAAFP